MTNPLESSSEGRSCAALITTAKLVMVARKVSQGILPWLVQCNTHAKLERGERFAESTRFVNAIGDRSVMSVSQTVVS